MLANTPPSSFSFIKLQCLIALMLSMICLFAPVSSFFDAATLRTLSAVTLCASYYFFTRWMLIRHRAKQTKKTQLSDQVSSPTADHSEGTDYLVVFASQTGYAEQLAQQTYTSLQQAGSRAELVDIAELQMSALVKYKHVLFLVSTTGEGDAPDSAAGFLGQLNDQASTLTSLRYAILALGDRHYKAFCAFGHQLDQALHQQGGRRLFDLLEVDNGDEAALRHWQQQLGQLTGNTSLPDWHPAQYENWHLVERRLLNEGSAGNAVYLIRLQPPSQSNTSSWQAGDILEISPRRPHDDTAWPHREYSIASIMQDGVVELVVRQTFQADGSPGLGSGWLNLYAELGAPIAARLRSNRSFHAPQAGTPMILIGNGTGIAGLRAHIKQRQQHHQDQNWLIFGERHRATDFFFEDEISAWQTQGVLQRLDLAFSRDQEQRLYVQHQLKAAANEVQSWINKGAAIYVCGSLQGMASEVDASLRDILGDARVEQLREQGLYRRDVY
jgi:sulfite reductase (NADPH) flavoprotein alpha-component